MLTHLKRRTIRLTGEHCVSVLLTGDTNQPVQNARVEVSYTADPESVLEVLDTDNSGLTEDVGLAAPPLEYSMEPGIEQPYAEYTVTVRAEGYEAFSVSAVNVLSGN